MFTKLFGSLENTAETAKYVKALQVSMGKKETGGVREILSKALEASGSSPTKVDAILKAAARGGASVKSLGGTDEGLLAAVAQVSSSTGNAEEAGTAIRALANIFLTKGGKEFYGRGLLGGVRHLAGKGWSKQRVTKFLGSEAFNAYSVLAENMGEVETLKGEIGSAQRTDKIGGVLRTLAQNPEVNSALMLRKATAADELGTPEQVLARNTADTLMAQASARARARGDSEITIALMKMFYGGVRLFGGDEAVVKSFPDARVKEITDLQKSAAEDLGAANREGREELLPANLDTPTQRER